MLALRKTGPGPGLSIEDVAEPAPGAGEMLIAVEAAGICGSDLHVDDWSASYHSIGPSLPVTLGHEFAGRVAAHGPDTEAESLPVGSRVIVMPSVTCGACAHCRAGDVERCTTRTGIGMTRNGAFARLVTAPARNCIPVAADLGPGIAALAEPLTVAWQAVKRGRVSASSRVLVLGPGTIGQGIALMAREAAAALVAVAGRDDGPRLATASALGFEDVFDLAEPADEGRLNDLAGAGFDVVLEAAGSAAAVRLAIERLRSGGVLVVAGIHDAPAPLDATIVVRREINIRGSYRAPLSAWPIVLAMLSGKPDAFAPMITRRMPLSEALDAFALAHRRAESKILLLP